MENANRYDWREEIFQMIRSKKELYLPGLSDIYQKGLVVLEHEESLNPQQQCSKRLEILVRMTRKLEEVIELLCIAKSDITAETVDTMNRHEEQISTVFRSLFFQKYQTQHDIRQSFSSRESGQVNALNTNANYGGDWQEEVFQKIKSLKDMYLPDLTEIHQSAVSKLQQRYSYPLQQRPEQFEIKLEQLKIMTERMIQFLSVSKNNIMPGLKDKVDDHEKEIKDFLNKHSRGKNIQQGQLPQSHTDSGSSSGS